MTRQQAIAILATILLLGAGAALLVAWSQKKQEMPAPRPGSEGVACTLEAKLCPDGSYVGRTGPSCQFAECPSAPSQETIMIAMDTAGNIAGMQITPLEVLEDSRCPVGVRCIQAGTVRIRAQVTKGASASVYEFVLNVPQVIQGVSLTMTAVSPAQDPGGALPRSAYRFTFTGSGI